MGSLILLILGDSVTVETLEDYRGRAWGGAGSMSVSRSWTLARVLCLVNHGAEGSASLHGGSNRVIHTNTEQIWGRPRSPQTSALAAGVRAAR